MATWPPNGFDAHLLVPFQSPPPTAGRRGIAQETGSAGRDDLLLKSESPPSPSTSPVVTCRNVRLAHQTLLRPNLQAHRGGAQPVSHPVTPVIHGRWRRPPGSSLFGSAHRRSRACRTGRPPRTRARGCLGARSESARTAPGDTARTRRSRRRFSIASSCVTSEGPSSPSRPSSSPSRATRVLTEAAPGSQRCRGGNRARVEKRGEDPPSATLTVK